MCLYQDFRPLPGNNIKTVLLQEESAALSTSVTSEVAVEHTQEV